MFGAENPRKVQNLVEGNYEYLLKIYEELLDDLKVLRVNENVKIDSKELTRLWENLPESIQNKDKDLKRCVEYATNKIHSINRKGSFKGILCGAFSTDISKSAKYTLAKLSKGFKRNH